MIKIVVECDFRPGRSTISSSKDVKKKGGKRDL